MQIQKQVCKRVHHLSLPMPPPHHHHHQWILTVCISLIQQGFGKLALGLSCSMHTGQEQLSQASRVGTVLGALLGD